MTQSRAKINTLLPFFPLFAHILTAPSIMDGAYSVADAHPRRELGRLSRSITAVMYF